MTPSEQSSCEPPAVPILLEQAKSTVFAHRLRGAGCMFPDASLSKENGECKLFVHIQFYRGEAKKDFSNDMADILVLLLG